MADFLDSEAFNATQRASMEPCTAPTVEDFEYNQNTLIWVNIDGEMRVYSYNGAKIQYQVVSLGAKIDEGASVGAIATVSIENAGSFVGADGDYSAFALSSDGSGFGAFFTVTKAGSVITVVVIDFTGQDYAVDEIITLSVDTLSEFTPCTLRVASVT